MTFNSAPDYETKNTYAVKLNVAAGSLSASQDITITISNVPEPIVWQLTEPESVGMSSTKLSDAFDKVLADGSYTQGALVIKDGKLVYERYRGIAVNEEKTLKDKNWEGYSDQYPKSLMVLEIRIVSSLLGQQQNLLPVLLQL